jgi:hypothetical protein
MQKHLVNDLGEAVVLNENMNNEHLLDDADEKQKNKSDCRHCSKESCSKRNAAYEID